MSRRLVVILVACVVAACSEPPDKERQQAEGALQAAREADAAAYAPEPLHAAEAALQKYDEAVAQRDYRLALNDALEARDKAYEAVKEAGNKKAEVRSQAERLTSELEAQVASLTSRLGSTAAQHAPPSATDRLRASLRTATSALQEARALLATREYLRVVSQVRPILEGLRQEAPPEAPVPKKKK